MYTIFKNVIDWSDEEFKDKTPQSIFNHLVDEVCNELSKDLPIYSIDLFGRTYQKNKKQFLEEMSDVQMLLWDLLHTSGISFEEFMSAINCKLIVNKKREWLDPDEYGVVRHKK